jgi:hypothetical protein
VPSLRLGIFYFGERDRACLGKADRNKKGRTTCVTVVVVF